MLRGSTFWRVTVFGGPKILKSQKNMEVKTVLWMKILVRSSKFWMSLFLGSKLLRGHWIGKCLLDSFPALEDLGSVSVYCQGSPCTELCWRSLERAVALITPPLSWQPLSQFAKFFTQANFPQKNGKSVLGCGGNTNESLPCCDILAICHDKVALSQHL